ncbi:hypothetical protein ACX5I6_09740 [Arthrobacter sp. MMS24-T111]
MNNDAREDSTDSKYSRFVGRRILFCLAVFSVATVLVILLVTSSDNPGPAFSILCGFLLVEGFIFGSLFASAWKSRITRDKKEPYRGPFTAPR